MATFEVEDDGKYLMALEQTIRETRNQRVHASRCQTGKKLPEEKKLFMAEQKYKGLLEDKI